MFSAYLRIEGDGEKHVCEGLIQYRRARGTRLGAHNFEGYIIIYLTINLHHNVSYVILMVTIPHLKYLH